MAWLWKGLRSEEKISNNKYKTFSLGKYPYIGQDTREFDECHFNGKKEPKWYYIVDQTMIDAFLDHACRAL